MSKDDREPEKGLGSFLTERQVRVLELRLKGHSQQDIVDILATTRSNISILRKELTKMSLEQNSRFING
jgi:Tfx family DNA-binding protein